LCCAKLGEAEALADGGLDGLLVTSPIVAAHALARLGALNTRVRDLMVVADSETCVDGYARVARESRRELKVLVDVDIGLHRTGVAPGAPAVKLAKRIQAAGLRFMGLQGYAGQLQHVPTFEERRAKSLEALGLLRQTRELLGGEGVACRTPGGLLHLHG
jgi:D-serine deaminase-like pyridoxal phosphate-dependent protein